MYGKYEHYNKPYFYSDIYKSYAFLTFSKNVILSEGDGSLGKLKFSIWHSSNKDGNLSIVTVCISSSERDAIEAMLVFVKNSLSAFSKSEINPFNFTGTTPSCF